MKNQKNGNLNTQIEKYFIYGFVGNFGKNIGRKLKECERTVTLSDRLYFHTSIPIEA